MADDEKPESQEAGADETRDERGSEKTAADEKSGAPGDSKTDKPDDGDAESEGEKDDASEKKRASSPWPSARKSDKPAPPAEPAPKHEDSGKAAWGAPLAKLDRAWTTFESRLCAAVLVAEVLTLVFWISIRALSATGRAGPA